MLRTLFGLALLAGGFFLGVGWTGSQEEAVIDDQEIAATQPVVPDGSRATADDKPRYSSDEEATIALFEEAAPSVTFITTTNLRSSY